MDLDYDPIYCVEQIQIPPGLPQLLKRFAKEVIRSQPSSLEEFAASYFNNLLRTTKQDAKAPSPTLLQLQAIWDQLKDADSMSPDDVAELCVSHGVSRTMFQKVFQLVEFPSDPVDPKEVIALLITTVAKTFVSVLDFTFKVFGHKTGNRLSIALFFKVLFLLAKRDPDISSQFVTSLTQDLDGKDTISYAELKANTYMQQYFGSKQQSGCL
ncbi:hypothetical protein O6H91_01G103800 [Diphasiastrum complanatum]|uniref:Uncharacterized protein n=3 Tax=Diphasiastrum complanatum TaxID=34168 RepID=A0ACC2EU21_DIPCM|nr:hypothetical protein O6H91_01G103800 [Diphasiastrum complanatum]KAJ7570011.1 hypothetical protein O6H91_01G103800 [Diphasiastrum complanatum]KAJ7570012.1 hypothetical protein O6H91_01G103800 [Diphasiastrum complanatum]